MKNDVGLIFSDIKSTTSIYSSIASLGDWVGGEGYQAQKKFPHFDIYRGPTHGFSMGSTISQWEIHQGSPK